MVEGFLWVKAVVRIRIRDADEDWTLKINGAESLSLDSAEFADLVSTPGNEGSWQDIQGRTWTGLSIGALIKLAAGAEWNGDNYTVEFVGVDGSTLSVDFMEIEADDDYIVANQMEGNPLGDKEFPISLVDKKVAGGKYLCDAEEFIQGITEIRVTTNWGRERAHTRGRPSGGEGFSRPSVPRHGDGSAHGSVWVPHAGH